MAQVVRPWSSFMDSPAMARTGLLKWSHSNRGPPSSCVNYPGNLRFIRSFFGSMLVADPPTARMILERGLSLPAPVGRMLIANLAGWDAGEVEVALDCIAVPLLAIQTTTMDTARQRASLQPGESSPWLDLIRAHVPHAAITTLFGSGHFPQIERSQEITELIACFAQL